jgi:hypothetical protein
LLLLGIVQELLATGVVSWSTTISAHEKGRQWKKAIGLLQGMAHQWLAANMVS